MSSSNNPFSIIFGKEPAQYIERDEIISEIVSDFTAEIPSLNMVLLTGVRGSGKSALTSVILKEFSGKKDWYTADLLVEGDMLYSLAGKLRRLPGMKDAFDEVKVSFSALNIAAELSGEKKSVSVDADLDHMLSVLKNKGMRLLITIDDVASTPAMKTFAHFYQSCLMKDYDVFLVMSGVFENIENLQNQKTLTFLQRAPKMRLEMFSERDVADLYSGVFHYPTSLLTRMAKYTGGYPYAVQVLGYLAWKSNYPADIDEDRLLKLFDNKLAEGVYDKLWEDMSEKDREIALAMAGYPTDSVPAASIIDDIKDTKQNAANYKRRLIKRGILADKYGVYEFALPRFKEYVIAQRDYL